MSKKVKKPKNYLIIIGKGTIATTDTPKSLAKEWKVKQKEVIQLRMVKNVHKDYREVGQKP